MISTHAGGLRCLDRREPCRGILAQGGAVVSSYPPDPRNGLTIQVSHRGPGPAHAEGRGLRVVAELLRDPPGASRGAKLVEGHGDGQQRRAQGGQGHRGAVHPELRPLRPHRRAVGKLRAPPAQQVHRGRRHPRTPARLHSPMGPAGVPARRAEGRGVPVGGVPAPGRGFLRISTNPRLIKPPLAVDEATEYIEGWRGQSSWVSLPESSGPSSCTIAESMPRPGCVAYWSSSPARNG